MSSRSAGTAVTLAAILGSSSLVSASPQYPTELRSALGLDYTPSCTLCHGSATASSAGPVDTPFGKSMLARGLRGEMTSPDAGIDADAGVIDPSLSAALALMRGVDSDGDGMEDLDELSWHGDPNHYDGLRPDAAPQVNYGCQLVHSPSSPAAVFAGLVGLSIAFVGRRLRKT